MEVIGFQIQYVLRESHIKLQLKHDEYELLTSVFGKGRFPIIL